MRTYHYFVISLLLSISIVGFPSSIPVHAETSAPPMGSFPFFDDFEAGRLDADWSTNSWGSGRAEIGSDAPHSGLYNVFLGQKVGGNSGASLVLSVDLANQSDVYLDFWWRAIDNAPNTNNGVFISDNGGTSWTKIVSLNGNSHTYSHSVINVSNSAAANGLVLNEQFQFRFRFEAFNEPMGALVIDDIRLTTHTQAIATFPLRETFDAATLGQGFYPQSWGTGIAEVSSEDPVSGTNHLSIGTKTAGNGGATLTLILDLSNTTEVFLDFWWRATGNAPNGNNGVYINDGTGTNWIKVANLNGNSRAYGHVVVNIAAIAEANGLSLNDQFHIRFNFVSFNEPIGGLRLDDVRLTTRENVISAFPTNEFFDGATLQQGFYPQSWGPGLAEMSSEDPYNGIGHLFIGQKASGNAGALLIIVVDLSKQSAAFLDFWWRSTGSTPNNNNGVYISDDDGLHWTKIANLTGNPQIYGHLIINLAEKASAHGLTLNDRFRIQIRYESFNQPMGGLRIDDLRLSTEHPATPTPTPILTATPVATPNGKKSQLYLPYVTR